MIQQFYPQTPHNFMYELNKDMNMAAAHFIPSEKAGACAKVHGHTYFINITIAGDELDDTGFLINFQQVKKLVHGRYDHTLMNDHPEFSSKDEPYHFPSTEVVARQIWETVSDYLLTTQNKPVCTQVVVRETPTSYVVFRAPQVVDAR